MKIAPGTSKSIVVILLILLSTASLNAHALTCSNLLSKYVVPDGFSQELYDFSLAQLQAATGELITHNPSSEFSISDKQHTLALVMAADITLEKLGDAQSISLALPERLQDLFVKMATTMASARAGDLDEVVSFMKNLIAEERYQEWLNLVTDFHQSVKKIPTEVEQPFKLVLSDSIHEYFIELGFNLAQIYDEDADQLSYPQFDRALEWKGAQSLATHFKKRTQKDSMDLKTEADLVSAANRFLSVSGSNQIVFYRSDGTLVKYDSSTSELAIVSPEQTIITYYFVKYRPPEELAAYMKYVFREPPRRK